MAEAKGRVAKIHASGEKRVRSEELKKSAASSLIPRPLKYMVASLLLLGAVGYVKDSMRVPVYDCPSEGEADIEVESGRRIQIRHSSPDQVCVLHGRNLIGRSYGGNSWEASHASEHDFACEKNGVGCSVHLPREHRVLLKSYTHGSENKSASEVARFLMQTTFGPRQQDIDSWGGLKFKDWILQQMSVTPTLHRAYYRSRVNRRISAQHVPGRPRSACESFSRWHRWAFNFEDIGKVIITEEVPGSKLALSIDGVVRTEVPASEWGLGPSAAPFKVCDVQEKVGGQITLGAECAAKFENPGIAFSSPPEDGLLLVPNNSGTLLELVSPVADVRVLELGSGIVATGCKAEQLPTFYHDTEEDLYYKHDARIVLAENTLDSPGKTDPTRPYCSNVVKTFLNKDSCVIGGPTCTPQHYSSAIIKLTDGFVFDYYNVGGMYLYRIQGLRLDDEPSPCATGISRWRRVLYGTCGSKASNGDLDAGTLQTLLGMFEASKDDNHFIKDLRRPTKKTCSRPNTKGIKLELPDGTCWEHVHKEEWNIYDFTKWADQESHPGNAVALAGGRPNPIENFAREKLSYLKYPSHHIMKRWDEMKFMMTLIGRYQDTIDFNELPSSLRTEAMAKHFGAVPEDDGGMRGATETCGSPGEVANKPVLGSQFLIGLVDGEDGFYRSNADLDHPLHFLSPITATWTMIALHAPDQLRQRVAFALSQILVVTQLQVNLREQEMFAQYYDIFVRNAMGNYRDVLKEVSFSPAMARMLTYLGSKSFQFSRKRFGREIFPDENYAREIMQLFTIGLAKLNNDGSIVRDSNGVQIETYTNEDIMSFSRVWTGFDHQLMRGNIETNRDIKSRNDVDPMRINPDWRDSFPKMNLYGGHLGDKLPLCKDLPSKNFLRKGATYSFIGRSPLPRLIKDPVEFDLSQEGIKRVDLDPTSSALHSKLCIPDDMGICKYKSEVILDALVPCDGLECTIETVRVVNVSNAFYEYVQPPCTELMFIKDAVTIAQDNLRDGLCADRNSVAAGEACCNVGTKVPHFFCNYNGEEITFADAEHRCRARGMELCGKSTIVKRDEVCKMFSLKWTSASCRVLAKIRSDGKVAVVHELGHSDHAKNHMSEIVREDTKNWFRVGWLQEDFPARRNNCNGVCTRTSDNQCLCSATVTERAVFSSFPSKDEIMEKLHIGSLPIDVYDMDAYIPIESCHLEVEAFMAAGGEEFDDQTIFKITHLGKALYLRNVESIVEVESGAQFRNPPGVMQLREATVRDALYETDAAIDHYITHPNCPPFIAYRLIQRLVTSNPSPRYIDACATAFKTGVYHGIGSGEYGDLAATVAAILLDREARDVLLDSDPTFGQVREPLLKLIHAMRSMETVSKGNREIEFFFLHEKIGQMAHKAPGVFNFFKPEYTPPGPISEHGLVSPESQLMTGPKVLSLVSGVISHARLGFFACGFGFTTVYENVNCHKIIHDRRYRENKRVAHYTWQPSKGSEATSEEVVNELGLLLTASRLETDTKTMITAEYEESLRKEDQETAIAVAQQLILGTPEFHVSNLVNRKVGVRRPVPAKKVGRQKFKAIVYLYISGGMDSFNLLVPHSNCKNGKNKYQEYADIRTDIALPKEDLIVIDVPAGTQVCDRFGIHPKMPVLADLFTSKEALLLANLGPLIEPVTRQEVGKMSKRLPASLYAHNIQSQATQTLFPQTPITDGVLGRANDALFDQGFVPGAFSINGNNHVMQGTELDTPKQAFIRNKGLLKFNSIEPDGRVSKAIRNMTSDEAGSVFGETWSAVFSEAATQTSELVDVLDKTELVKPWTNNEDLGQQFHQVAKLIKAHEELGNDRQSFFVQIHGLDSHSSVAEILNKALNNINNAIASFVEEMKAQGLWDQTVIVAASEFGRTITSNGAGTDHGWGGNYFLMGGGLNGGKILGEYPHDLSNSGKESIGRGRFVPTMSWDEVWKQLLEWYGVDDAKVSTILPNYANFADTSLLKNVDFFKSDATPGATDPLSGA